MISARVRLMRSKLVRLGLLAVVLALIAVALVDQAGTLGREIQRLTAPVVLLAFAASLGGLLCSLMVWRELLADLGSRLSMPDAFRLMFIGPLAEYVSRSILPGLAPAEVRGDRGVPPGRGALALV